MKSLQPSLGTNAAEIQTRVGKQEEKERKGMILHFVGWVKGKFESPKGLQQLF